ncbi:uncharacterized protein K02A2.6-like [Anneissia japonica]|uniref:uncharacterized protein K02A2.6-like n=1 Tax=Anneissia japonica TaxID=1529436 RepID=UPI001425B7EA|nr:uncharacterized protein K02A2.6-like [Anneissia japonica]
MVIQHQKGKLHTNADALSRIDTSPNHHVHKVLPDHLPCGSCSYCQRAHARWASFRDEVDDVVPIGQVNVVRVERENTEGQVTIEIYRPSSDDETNEISILQDEGRVFAVKPSSDVAMCWGYSCDEIKQHQRSDSDLIPVFDWLENEEPSKDRLFLTSPATKFFWLNRKRLHLTDKGILFLRREDSAGHLLVLPRELQPIALRLHHDIPSASHQGVKRTKHRLKEKFCWYGMGKDVERYVTTCENCNRSKKTTRKGKYPMTEFHAGVPMERVHIDFLGPLPKTEQGNIYILVMVDQFTKWVEISSLPSQTSEVTARAVVRDFFSRFGVLFQLHSDQGRNFESELFISLCKVLQIHKTRSTSYRPSANGQVERFNRTLMDAVRCFMGKRQKDWDIHLLQIAGALRSTVNRSTVFTPNMLMLGHEVSLLADLVFGDGIPENAAEVGTYITELVTSIRDAHEVARQTLRETQRHMKRNYDLRILKRPYQIGDKVYVLDHSSPKGKCKKLCPPWKGPGVIIEVITPYLFRVKLRNKVMTLNHDKLKPCRDRQLPKWLTNFSLPSSSFTDKEDDDSPDTLYCYCRQPWAGTFMIQCDYCDVWYHGSCVNVLQLDALNTDLYKCAGCRD